MFSETFTTKKRSIVLFDGRVTDVGIQKVTFPCKSERGAKGGKMGTEGDGEEEERKKKREKSEAEANGEVSPFCLLGTNSPTLEKKSRRLVSSRTIPDNRASL